MIGLGFRRYWSAAKADFAALNPGFCCWCERDGMRQNVTAITARAKAI
jgi:hypothetical protein